MCHSKSILRLFFSSGSRVKKRTVLYLRTSIPKESIFPRTYFICYQRGAQMAFYVPYSAQGGGRCWELRLDWLPLGMKAVTKGLYFVQVGICVP